MTSSERYLFRLRNYRIVQRVIIHMAAIVGQIIKVSWHMTPTHKYMTWGGSSKKERLIDIAYARARLRDVKRDAYHKPA